MKRINWLDHLLNFFGVILGVLLAFYIGAAAEKSKDKQELDIILQSLVRELEMDERAFKEGQIPSNTQQSSALNSLLEGLITENQDTINQYLSSILNLDNSSPNSTTYTSVLSSGRLELIDDLNLKLSISRYYEELAQEAQWRGEVQWEFLKTEILPWLSKHVDLMDMQPNQVAGNTEFTNKVIIYQGLLENKLDHYQKIADAASNLKQDITQYLNL